MTPKPEPRLIKLGDVTFSGSLRLRVENWNWFDTSAADDTYTFAATLLRLSLGRQGEKIDIGRPSGGNRSLGTMVELSVDWNLTPKKTLTFYGAGVRGGGVQRFVYPEGGTNPGLHYLYIEFNERF